MNIEVWSDFACPFCYIGKRRLEEALSSFPHKDKVQIIFKSFELQPDAPRDTDQDIHTMLAQKYGMSVEKAREMNANVTEQAAAVGLTYHMDDIILTNTFDAHRLTHFANQNGKLLEMTERLLKAYFTDGKHLGDHETLADLAEEVGLDRAKALQVLAGDEFTAEVRADEQEAAQIGVRGVPFFVFNRKFAVSGAQPANVFQQALQKAWDEAQPLTVLGDDSNAACEDGACGVPNNDREA